jgi:hypothetical protein
MPKRDISPQSFDDILSELGDDPAIPDPHGIRKSPAPKDPAYSTSSPIKNDFLGSLHFQAKGKNVWLFLIFACVAIAITTTIFLAFESFKTDSQLAFEGTQNQLIALKKEFAQYRNDVETDQDDLYQAMDELEVSIHTKLIPVPQTKNSSTPRGDLHESELRRWRYLGMTQVGGIQQAFFFSRNTRFSLQLGSPVLGDWRLSEIQKTQATIINPKGKSLILKASKIE